MCRRIDPRTGEVLERLEMPPGAAVSGLESDGGDRFFCGGGSSGKVRAVRRPKRGRRGGRGARPQSTPRASSRSGPRGRRAAEPDRRRITGGGATRRRISSECIFASAPRLYDRADAAALHSRLAGRRGRRRAGRRPASGDPRRETDRRRLAARRRRADIDGGPSDHCPPHLVVAGGNRSGDRGAGLRVDGSWPDRRRPGTGQSRPRLARCARRRAGAGGCRRPGAEARLQAPGARLGGLPAARRARIRTVAIRRRASPPHRSPPSARGRRWRLCSKPISAAAAPRRCWRGGRGARPARRSARSCCSAICAVSPSCRSPWRRRRWWRRWTPGSTASPAPFTRSAARC